MDQRISGEVVYPKYRWLMLLTICISTAAGAFANGGYAPILGEIAKSLKVGMGSSTQLMTATALTAAIFFLFSGAICDRYGVTTVLVLGLLCIGIPAALMPWFGYSYKYVIIAKLFLGASIGLVGVAVGPVLALWFPRKEMGRVASYLGSSVALGGALGVLISPAIMLITHSWEKTIVLMSALAWIGFVMAVIITRRPPSPDVLASIKKDMKLNHGGANFKKLCILPVTLIGCSITTVMQWTLQGIHYLVPPYLAVAPPVGLGYGPMMSGKLSFGLFLAGLFGPLLGGFFHDKVAKGNSKPSVILGFAATGICVFAILLPFVYTSVANLSITLLIAGFGVAFTMPAVISFVAVNYPPDMVGKMLGLWNGVAGFGGVAGLYLGGLAVSRMGNYNLSIGLIPIVCGLGVFAAIFLRPIRAFSHHSKQVPTESQL
jgi:MFS family permease